MMIRCLSLLCFLSICVPLTAMGQTNSTLPTLQVSANKRFLVTHDGKPFFWLGDTAWEIFHRLNRDEALQYLEHRSLNQFNVIQAVALAEFDGLNSPNAYGHKPLEENDPTRPLTVPGPENDYWDHVDFVVEQANTRGMYVGLLPTWGDKWNKKWGQGPEIFTPLNAEVYGEWIARRYRNAGIIWILGGDRPIENEAHAEIIRAMARGIQKGDGGSHLITWHPTGGSGSSQYFHTEDWLDFNMRQNGHATDFTGHYDATYADYQKNPVKPVLDGEPLYEDHPVSFDQKKFGHSIAADVRRPLYWNLFQGAFGHTYGHHSVWQMASNKYSGVNDPLLSWTRAIDQPGAMQMKHAKQLLESRPFLSRIPDPTIIVEDKIPTKIPGAGRYRFVATRDEPATYAFVYAPIGREFRVRMNCIPSPKITGWWFNPRNGEATKIGEYSNTKDVVFTPPDLGEMLDWILVLDDSQKGYPPPGSKKLD